MKPVVSRLTLFPFKSLDGFVVPEFVIGDGSYVIGDRRYALFDQRGKYINGKAEPLVHRLRLSANEKGYQLFSSVTNQSYQFESGCPNEGLTEFFTIHFGRSVEVRENNTGDFQDVPHNSAVTLVSLASLKKTCEWMGIENLDEVRRRFRATIEIDGVEAFWEDCLFGSPGDRFRFRLGDVEMESVGPRERCVVPTRHPESGEVSSGFAKQFALARWNEVKDDSKLHDWNHGYFLSVDCRILPASFGKRIITGDELVI